MEKRHIHVLKHTRAIDLAELDLDLDDVQFWLGHKKYRKHDEVLGLYYNAEKKTLYAIITFRGM